MTQPTKDRLWSLIPWTITALVAVGSWIAWANGERVGTQNNFAALKVRVETNSEAIDRLRSRLDTREVKDADRLARIEMKLDEIGRKIDRMP